ncbi:MAG: hypothetical protein ACK5Z2_09010 [Bacteroidota bacterium]|jgi:hypothetical protein
MHNWNFENDVAIVCAKATSFPDGVMAAFQQLHTVAPPIEGRSHFSVSWLGADGEIEYMAGATELQTGEIQQSDFVNFTISAGKYLYIDVHDFMKDIPAIGKTFQQLLASHEVSKDTVCIEWYVSDKLCRCMVKSV